MRETFIDEVPILKHYNGDPRAMVLGNNKFIDDRLPPEIEDRMPHLRKKLIQRELKDNLIKEKLLKM